jgi:hypothetical protein
MTEGAAEAAGGVGWARYRVVLFFALGLAAVDAGVASQRHLWRAYDPDDYQLKTRDCRRQSPDLVLIGGSPVCEGLDPAVLSGVVWQGQPLEHVYNLGLSGATTSEMWHAVEHGIGAPPRLLVYGITASDLNDGRDEPHGPRSLMNVRDVARWVRLRPEAAEWCLRHWTLGRLSRAWNLFHFRNGIRLCFADNIERLSPETCPQAAAEAREGLRYARELRDNHGFAPRAGFQLHNLAQSKAAGSVPERFHFLEKYSLGGHLRYLHRLLEWADANGVAVVLVDMPVSDHLEETMHAQAFAAYRKALAEVEHSRNVRVLRATRAAVGLTDTDFADLIHLNNRGAARLSAWLRQELARTASEPGMTAQTR